ncbi:MAG: SsrA-binding protein, partial [Candidatus Marinimicrobia bacterium]|nr:SsrA-binding protein [Candidatus Neomarinimicrobiota bacterium]
MESKGITIITSNKKAYHDYHIIDKIEAGLELKGTEVKSLRAGHAHLKDSYARIRNGEMFLLNAHISPYKYSGGYDNHEPERDR